jgi:hypothetical protein
VDQQTPETVRTTNGRGRARYHPEWHKEQPWVCDIDGEAYVNCYSLQQCRLFFRSKGLMLKLPEKG